jgi:hypothetical protein
MDRLKRYGPGPAAERLIRQPEIGDIINAGCYGIAVVVSVGERGEQLRVRDTVNRCHDVERAPKGYWTRIVLPVWRPGTFDSLEAEVPFCPTCVQRGDEGVMEVTAPSRFRASGVLICRGHGRAHYAEDLDVVRQATALAAADRTLRDIGAAGS